VVGETYIRIVFAHCQVEKRWRLHPYNQEMVNEHEFRRQAEEAVRVLKAALIKAEETADIEVEEQGGVLTIEFEEPPAKFVITPNSAAGQIWISALGTSFKLDLTAQGFILAKSGEPLPTLVARLVNEQLGEQVVTL